MFKAAFRPFPTYGPVELKHLVRPSPPQNIRLLSFLLDWHDALAAFLSFAVMMLTLSPILRVSLAVIICPIVFILYLCWVVWMRRSGDLNDDIHLRIAFVLLVAACVFSFVIAHEDRMLGSTPDPAAWLFVVLPLYLVARYGRFSRVLIAGLIVVLSVVVSGIIDPGPALLSSVRMILLHLLWLGALSLLPLVMLRFFSLFQYSQFNSLSLVSRLVSIPFSSEVEYANTAAKLIADYLDVAHVNVLRAAPGRPRGETDLIFIGAASPAGQALVARRAHVLPLNNSPDHTH